MAFAPCIDPSAIPDELMMEIEVNTKFVAGDSSVRLTWKDVTVMVTLSNDGEAQNVLEGLTGYAEPGNFTALMGPSGSGKSTLLDALSGRLPSNAFCSGTILFNGRRPKLSFGNAVSIREKLSLVESTIIEMGLQDCVDTVVGNWHLRGISGGEKRRLSIALEILTRPSLLFLDEPTTGLDREGRTVIASIHQPSCEVLSFLIDCTYFLVGRRRTLGRLQKLTRNYQL
ncbi:OLC1v1030316C2 [Oldenlandia corymbosa var. corymbosa]|uniref:OLC1v1030316C2 n=1 Tax=Oldenlandia corymbosa var. corymbosa TaxID=529605 RepID=A0AAV1CFM3_OLDCO|nr:OLC1v1030316C2 [Oldenlandia corymbosa var. corymbosa]